MEWISVDIKPPTTEAGEVDWIYQTSGKLLTYSLDFGISIGIFEFNTKFCTWRLDDESDVYEIEGITHWMPLPNSPEGMP